MFVKLQVGNLPKDFAKADLHKLFSGYEGNVYACFIVDDLENPYLKQGFVQIETDTATPIIETLHGQEVRGQQIRINETDQRTWASSMARLAYDDRRKVYELAH